MLPFEIQAAVMSGMAIATNSASGSDSSLDNVVRIQLRLKQFMKYIFLWKLWKSTFSYPPRMAWPKPSGTIDWPSSPMGRSGPRFIK